VPLQTLDKGLPEGNNAKLAAVKYLNPYAINNAIFCGKKSG
jgi:hypothetical protein